MWIFGNYWFLLFGSFDLNFMSLFRKIWIIYYDLLNFIRNLMFFVLGLFNFIDFFRSVRIVDNFRFIWSVRMIDLNLKGFLWNWRLFCLYFFNFNFIIFWHNIIRFLLRHFNNRTLNNPNCITVVTDPWFTPINLTFLVIKLSLGIFRSFINQIIFSILFII